MTSDLILSAFFFLFAIALTGAMLLAYRYDPEQDRREDNCPLDEW